ncbi:MAG: 30S ribosomal protein S20 [Elusimicrobia bacterium RIFCSPLOWO2_01_FULL_54_10]|nr:MAG: 30S ribosomal protein S20 [Elusimicrobia bacterium RIFCSPLOWO2_01_FULL_54_10]
MAKLKTGRHTSAIKQNRKAMKRQGENRNSLRKIRTLAKQFEAAVTQKKKAEAGKLLSQCFSAWDKAAKTGLIHDNAASRKKARLSHKLSQLAQAA